MKSDDLGWGIRSDLFPPYGMCCPKQKVGEEGVSEFFYKQKDSKSIEPREIKISLIVSMKRFRSPFFTKWVGITYNNKFIVWCNDQIDSDLFDIQIEYNRPYKLVIFVNQKGFSFASFLQLYWNWNITFYLCWLIRLFSKIDYRNSQLIA